jgi:hypothetical protein
MMGCIKRPNSLNTPANFSDCIKSDFDKDGQQELLISMMSWGILRFHSPKHLLIK